MWNDPVTDLIRLSITLSHIASHCPTTAFFFFFPGGQASSSVYKSGCGFVTEYCKRGFVTLSRENCTRFCSDNLTEFLRSVSKLFISGCFPTPLLQQQQLLFLAATCVSRLKFRFLSSCFFHNVCCFFHHLCFFLSECQLRLCCFCLCTCSDSHSTG